MSHFIIYIVLLIIGLVLSLYALIQESKGRKVAVGIAAAILVVSTISLFAAAEIPKPQIYTTNGNSLVDNEVYIEAGPLLSIKYTLVPYDDPQKEGVKYEGNIEIEGSMVISAKASLFGIKWSDLASRDIIVGSDGEIDIIETKEPGTSIQKISAYLTNNRFFPGDILKKEDIRVEGTTIAGETVTIEDFDFFPDSLIEGANNITVNYKNLSDNISYIADLPKLISLDAEYIGDELREGDIIGMEQFKVIGVYEDGKNIPLENFTLEPAVAESPGELIVTIKAEEVSTSVTVSILERQYAFTVASELHTPNGSYDPNVYVTAWEEGSDYSIDGKTFKNGIKLRFDNWMSGLMGNGRDFAEDVESNIYIAVNQEVLSKRPEEEQYFNGYFVIGRETNGSPTTAEISIYADEKEVYQSGKITAASTQIPSFHISTVGVERIVIQTKANVCGNDFVIGIIEE